jgi:hypothetical protein
MINVNITPDVFSIGFFFGLGFTDAVFIFVLFGITFFWIVDWVLDSIFNKKGRKVK